MGDLSVIIALLAVAVVGGLIAGRLQRAAKRGRAEGVTEQLTVDAANRLSASDQRFRLLSFQGGPVPADLGGMVEELRRNGIEVDEATLRQKLAEGVAPLSETKDGQPALGRRATPGTAIVLGAADVPGDVGPRPNTVRVQLTLELPIPNGEPIREQRVAVIAADKRALLVDGAAMPVRYDPDDPRAFTLEWEIT
jgi:hypothetical protein